MLANDAAGLGLRRALLGPLRDAAPGAFDFLEGAPDNWIGVGGRFGAALAELSERHPLVCHGLSLSLGGMAPFDQTHLQRLRRFLDAHRVPVFSEHLSYCADDGQLYDLLPMPFTGEAVRHVAARIRQVQDALGRRLAVENVSYYAAPHQAMAEIDFLNAVLAEADCELLLDVNNVYVNAINHRYDPVAFLDALPGDRISYLHVAGHYDEADDLKVDTHGAPVKRDVWALLDAAYARFGVRPTLLERDFHFPPFAELLGEVATIRDCQARARAGEVRRERA
jgi:hypothetical protein